MIPRIGDTVIYRLAPHDLPRIAERNVVGNSACVGDEYPMVIVRVWGSTEDSYVNGRAFLDDCGAPFWATSVKHGEGPGTFSYRHDKPIQTISLKVDLVDSIREIRDMLKAANLL